MPVCRGEKGTSHSFQAANGTQMVIFWLGMFSLETMKNTCWLMHAHSIKSNLKPLQSTIKLFVWAVISIKTFGTNVFEKLNCARECPSSTSQSWKGMIFYAVQCFRLLYSD